MEVRFAVHPDHAAAMDTDELRDHFLIQNLFVPGKSKLVYSYNDRLIIGGFCPLTPISLEIDKKIIGSEFLLERRELGLINVGGPGSVSVDGEIFSIATKDGLYVGMGARDIIFSSDSQDSPAKFYLNSTPAHATYPTTMVNYDKVEPIPFGGAATSNKRTIRKFIQPETIKSCQLVMGMTTLESGSVWNTMPTHTHERRMEVYFYFELPDDQVVFHFMGQPSETRHLILHNEEAALSPSWSIHSGVGTSNYTFIWGMAGENQLFDDMDHVSNLELR